MLARGGLVAFPTETVYGLGADATNAAAVARIFEAKRRPEIDPLIVHAAGADSARTYGRFPDAARVLMEKFWPGPLTLIALRTELVPLIVTAGLDTVAVRVPSHPAAQALLRAFGRGIAAPSANLFGRVSPTEAAHVAEQLSDRIDLILDGGRCEVGVESTILSLAGPVPRILRPGGTSKEDLAAVLGRVEWSPESSGLPIAPGQMVRHYATRTPLQIAAEDEKTAEPAAGERVGLLAFENPADAERFSALEVLSPSGDMREAAANLFSALRNLDRLDLDRIVARPLEERGLGAAIMDRLRRCSARR